MKSSILFIVVFAAILARGPFAIADDKLPAKKQGDSLDEQLLKGLPGDLLDGLDKPADKATDKSIDKSIDKPTAKPAAPPTDKPANKPPKKADTPLDQELLKALSEGEDIGESGNPLVRIEKQMRTVEQKLAQAQDGGEAREMQTKIVADLELLIKQLKQQQKQQQSAVKSPGKGPERGQVNQPDPKSSGGGNNDPKGGAAKDSTAKLHDGKAKEVDMAEMKKLLTDLWGDLPEREREALMNSSGDSFLPKYQFEIEKYFRRLGEQPKKP